MPIQFDLLLIAIASLESEQPPGVAWSEASKNRLVMHRKVVIHDKVDVETEEPITMSLDIALSTPNVVKGYLVLGKDTLGNREVKAVLIDHWKITTKAGR